MDKNKKRLALELTLAGGMAAVGIVSGGTLGAVLVNLVSGIGGNWASELTMRAYQHWCETWFTEAGALNHDIQKALQASWQDAVATLARDWPRQTAYRRLSREDRSLTQEGLNAFQKESQSFWAQATAGDHAQEEFLALMLGKKQEDIKQRVAQQLSLYFYGYPESFLEYVGNSLLDLWLLHFQEFLKSEQGAAAWRALQIRWQGELSAALAQISVDVAATRAEVSALRQELQDWQQRLTTLPPAQRDETGWADFASQLDAMRGRLDAIYVDTQAIRQMLESIKASLEGRTPPGPPQNLPAAQKTFVGREQELQRLQAHLTSSGQGVALIAGVRGLGGVGKTELALQIAHRLADTFPARLFVAAGAREAADLLAEVIRLVEPTLQPPDDLAQRQSLARQLLAPWPGLLILDNVTKPEAVQPVLAALPAGWAALITSRRRFGLRGGLLLDLHELSEAEAVALLQELGVEADEDELAQLARACGRLPLALRVAAAFLRNHPDWRVDEYLARLQARGVTALHEAGAGDVAAVLNLSLEQLAAERPELAQRWHLLGVMPAPFDRALAAGVWGELLERKGFFWRLLQAFIGEIRPTMQSLDEEETREGLSKLLAWSLVEYDGDTGLYRLHDLLADLAQPDDAARLRHAHTVLDEARKADDAFMEGDMDALARFDMLWPHLQAAWAWMRTGRDRAALRWLSDFGWAFPYLLDLRTTPVQRIPYLQAAADAARALGDKKAEGAHLGNLGAAYHNLGRMEEAIAHYQQALAIAREFGDLWNEGRWLGNLGNVYYRLGRMEEAIDYYQQALAIAREIGYRRGEGNHLGNLGLDYAALGWMEEAIDYYQQALAIAREIGDRRGEGNWLGSLGAAYHNLGRMEEAIAYYQQALAIAREIGDRRGEGNWLGSLGAAYHNLGRMEEAIAYYQQALAIAREIGDRRGEGNHLGNLGAAYHNLGRMEEAIDYYQQALAIARDIGDRRGEGNHLGNLGIAYAALGRMEEVIDYYQQALAIARDIGDRRGEGIRAWNLGLIYEEQGDYARAAELMQILVDFEREIGHADAEAHAQRVAEVRGKIR